MAMANGSVNIDLKGGRAAAERNLKEKQPATMGQVRMKEFLIRHSHQTEIYSNSNTFPHVHS
jgi:hypothetical protein